MSTQEKQSSGAWAWCLYDWANSAFVTLVVTFIYATYFSQTFASDADRGTVLWSRAVAISSVIIALLAPVLGAWADRTSKRHVGLRIATAISVVATVALGMIRPTEVDDSGLIWTALGIFVVGNVAFEVGMVFYNSFLPSVAGRERLGRISGLGWGMGYLGGLLCLALALFGFVGLGDAKPWLTFASDYGFNVRATNFLVAGWFTLFSVPLLVLSGRLRQEPPPPTKSRACPWCRRL